MVILPKSLNSDDITIEVPDMQYSNKKAQYNPNPIVYDNGKKLVKNKDYTVSYEGNTKQDIGEIKETGHTAKVIITAKSADYLAEETTADGTENSQNPNTKNRRISYYWETDKRCQSNCEKQPIFQPAGNNAQQVRFGYHI